MDENFKKEYAVHEAEVAKFDSACNGIGRTADQLESVAFSLEDVGMNVLAEKMIKAAEYLRTCNEKITSFRSYSIDRDYKIATQGTSNILSALLARAKLEKAES